MTNKTVNKAMINIATILMAFSAVAFFWVRDIRFFLILAPSASFYYWYKKNHKDEKEKIEDFATKSSLMFLVIPIGILLSICLFVIGLIVYKNIVL